MKKSQLKYVIVSDLHFGERIGVLNQIDQDSFNLQDFKVSEATHSLVHLIKYLIKEHSQNQGIVLVLNGDLLGMSFGKMHEILSIFGSFLKYLLDQIPPGLISQIIYLPGNHDHHIWEMAREADYANQISQADPGKPFPQIKHTTGPYAEDGIESILLNSIFDKIYGHEKPDDLPGIKIVYPNLICHQKESNKVAIIHHGHFIEDIYNFVSLTRKALHPQIKLPTDIEEIEKENFAWIDFVWSTLGRSGPAGYDVEMIMKILGNPDFSKKEVELLSGRIAKALDFPFIPFDFIEKFLTKTLIQRISKRAKIERLDDSEICSEETAQQMVRYINGPCLNQIKNDIDQTLKNITFIWGHTHKPFEKKITTQNEQALHIYNTGGWTVDSQGIDRIRGGTIALMDTELDVVNLRVFDTRDEDGEIELSVHSVDMSTAIYKEVSASIQKIPEGLIQELKSTFAKETLLRRKYYRIEDFFGPAQK